MSVVANKSINLMLIGVGPHAQKVYVPWIARNGEIYGVSLKLAVELKSQIDETKRTFEKYGLSPELLFVDPVTADTIESGLRERLDDIVRKFEIEAVIIATEPSTHKAFGLWALDNDLHVLMDKPIGTVPNASNDANAARKILEDYHTLDRAYRGKKRQISDLLFSVNVQRRYHPGFDTVMERLREVADTTNCPVTSIQSSHGDGQWRTPDEVVDIAYHGFTNGYGKASHSGYHFFDIIGQFLKIGTPVAKRPNSMEIYTTFSKPSDYIRQFTLDDYSNVFKEEFLPKYDSEEFLKRTTSFGEIDCYSTMRFLQGNATITNVQLSLLHNSLSQRAWVKAHEDLYKGNGRVKHEYHCLQQGPFQSIQIHSYQSKDEHENNTTDDYAIGGNNHFDVHVFRNEKMIGGRRFEKFSIDDLLGEGDTSELLTTITKGEVLVEFFDHIRGNRKRTLRSDLSDQWLGVALMSSVYLSGVKENIVRGGISYEK